MSVLKIWTPYERNQLIKEIKNNCSIEEICRNHSRSPKAITFQLYNIAYQSIINKKCTMEKACEILKIDIESFKQVINNMNLYESIVKVKRPLTYIACEDQFIDDQTSTETSSSSQKIIVCTKCLKYESIINKFMMEYDSIKKKNKIPNKQMVFDIYSDDSDICEELDIIH